MICISCENVSLGYEGRPVLSDVSFTVSYGDYLCILGGRGTIKSTLIRGLLKIKAPLAGRIVFEGGLRPDEIGYLPQQTALQKDFPASVMEVALSGRLNALGRRPFYSSEDRRIAREKLALMGMDGFEKRCYQDLSGGQQQRVLLARALCATKKLLLLDEPVAGLDPVVSSELYELIRELNDKHGLTIIMVSHDVEEAVHSASHILHLGHGQFFYGSAAEYRSSDIGRSYIGGCENA